MDTSAASAAATFGGLWVWAILFSIPVIAVLVIAIFQRRKRSRFSYVEEPGRRRVDATLQPVRSEETMDEAASEPTPPESGPRRQTG